MIMPEAQVTLSGQFEYEVTNIYTEKTSPRVAVDNTILDKFYNDFLGSSGVDANEFFRSCDLDGSATPVAVTDTTYTKVGPAKVDWSGTETLQVLAPGQWKSGRIYTFGIATATATVNAFVITPQGSSALTARAVLPAPLTLNPGDILTIRHFVTATINLSDRTGLLTIDSNSYPYTMRWYRIDSGFSFGPGHAVNGSPWSVNTSIFPMRADIMAINGITAIQSQTLISMNSADFPATSGDVGFAPTIVAQPYTPGSFYRDLAIKLPYDQFNTPVGGIGSLVFTMTMPIVAGVTTGFFLNFNTLRLPKINTHEFNLTLRFTWGR